MDERAGAVLLGSCLRRILPQGAGAVTCRTDRHVQGTEFQRGGGNHGTADQLLHAAYGGRADESPAAVAARWRKDHSGVGGGPFPQEA